MQNGGEILENVGDQAFVYRSGVLTDRPFEATKLLLPIISNRHQAYDFVTRVTGALRIERVVMLALIFSGTGLLSKTGDTVSISNYRNFYSYYSIWLCCCYSY